MVLTVVALFSPACHHLPSFAIAAVVATASGTAAAASPTGPASCFASPFQPATIGGATDAAVAVGAAEAAITAVVALAAGWHSAVVVVGVTGPMLDLRVPPSLSAPRQHRLAGSRL